MLWFVTTRDKDFEDATQFWIALANDKAELEEIFNDEYTEFIDATCQVTEALIEQYGGVALLSTP